MERIPPPKKNNIIKALLDEYSDGFTIQIWNFIQLRYGQKYVNKNIIRVDIYSHVFARPGTLSDPMIIKVMLQSKSARTSRTLS
jgi:hypothetical protein